MQSVARFFQLELDEWLDSNLQREFILDGNTADARNLFAAVCWSLLKAKNMGVFRQEFRDAESVIRHVEGYASSLRGLSSNRRNATISYSRETRWQTPTVGWTKINTDGATKLDGSWSAGGGVLRDSRGRWLVGFQRYVGRGTTFNAEL